MRRWWITLTFLAFLGCIEQQATGDAPEDAQAGDALSTDALQTDAVATDAAIDGQHAGDALAPPDAAVVDGVVPDAAADAQPDMSPCVPGCEGRVALQCVGGQIERVPCPDDTVCVNAECVPASTQSWGTEFWAVDLANANVPNVDDLNALPFAVGVFNPNDEAVMVTAEDAEDYQLTVPVAAGRAGFLILDRRDVRGTVGGSLAYRISSPQPIAAWQHNPLLPEEASEEHLSVDGSLLLPAPMLGTRYRVMTREQSFQFLPGYLTVIATAPTQVRVTVTARTSPGEGIRALMPGERLDVELNRGDVLNLQTNGPGADLTGSLVEADQPVVVFGGSEGANAPNTNHCVDGACVANPEVACNDNYDCNDARLNTCCADHIEAQLPPISALGRQHVAARTAARGEAPDLWRILAVEDGTQVETVPPQAPMAELQAGEWIEIASVEDFEILSTQPVMVGHFLAGQAAPNPNERGQLEPGDAMVGDPSFLIVPGVHQFVTEHVFARPSHFDAHFLTIVAPADAIVQLNDAVLGGSARVGAWDIYRLSEPPTTGRVESDSPIAVSVYGWSVFGSYGFPATLGTAR